MQPGDIVIVHTDNPHIKDMINGKMGMIVEPEESGFFDWVVDIPASGRIGDLFALDEKNLKGIDQ